MLSRAQNIFHHLYPRLRGSVSGTDLNGVQTRPSSPVWQGGERRTTFWAQYASRRVPFFSFWLILHFTSDFIQSDAIINNACCTCHQ